MEHEARESAARLLDRLEARFGCSPALRRRMEPIVTRILESGAPAAQREDMLRLVVRAYSHHMRAWTLIDKLRTTLRDRLNDLYGRYLGIEPPGL